MKPMFKVTLFEKATMHPVDAVPTWMASKTALEPQHSATCPHDTFP